MTQDFASMQPEPGPDVGVPPALLLVASPDPSLRAAVLEALRGRHPVEAASGMPAAFDALRRHAPDLAVLSGADGLAILRELRSREATRATPVILLSAPEAVQWRLEGLKAGADDSLLVPFDPSELLARVEVHLGRSRQRRLEAPGSGGPRLGEEHFREFVRRSCDGIVIVSAEGRVLEWNEGQEAITGIPRAEALGRPVLDLQLALVPRERRVPEALRDAREAVRTLDQGSLHRVTEQELERSDGSRRIVESHAFTLEAGGGRVGAAIVRDITERRRVEEELRERKALLEEAEHLAHLGHWDADLRSGRVFWSDEVYRILGLAPGSVPPGREALLSPLADEDRARVEQAIGDTERDGRTRRAEFQVVTAQGERRWIQGSVRRLCDGQGRPSHVIGTDQDITDRKRSEEALAHSQEDLRRAQAVAHVGSWRMDARTRTLQTSEEAARILGVPHGVLSLAQGDPVHLYPEDAERVLEAWRGALQGKPYDHEHRILVDGQTRWIRGRAQPEFARDGTVTGCLGSVQDITDRKLLERALDEASRRKDEFLAVLSHELRNPLSPIRSSLFVLERAQPGGEQARRLLAVIDRQVAHLSRLVDDLLDVTRISRGKIQLRRERVELGGLVRRVLDDHRQAFAASGVGLASRLPEEPLWLEADPTRLSQVVGNLLTNAVKFTPGGGRVEISLEREAELVVLKVRDSGVGIGPEMLGRLFEPFCQADRTLNRARGGLGLGLALVKGLAELHGGTAGASSEGPGRGAEFAVRLPLRPVQEQARASAAPRPVHPRKVLIIEDNVDAANSLKEALELDGHAVRVAYDGPAGLASARADPPEVVLCDIGLPGMDGYDVARAFQADEKLRGSYLVAVSGYALPEDVRRARRAGFQRHLAKPPSFEQLEEVLCAPPPSPGAAQVAASMPTR